ncbi:MAG: NAD(P)H-binding protein [Flavobacteriaceae bacterium]
MIKNIGVLGCGWLGLPLAKQLVKEGHSVYGTTTSKEKLAQLTKEAIQAYKIALNSSEILGDIRGFLSHVDILIVNVPPKLRGKKPENFVEKMKLLHLEVKKSNVSKLIFISSTSVYGAISGEVTEENTPLPNTESGIQLYESEQLFSLDTSFHTTIIRFGGLIGPTRHRVTMLSKRKNLSNGGDPVNLIHLLDCIHMIMTIIKNEYWGELFNGVYPLHPIKEDYYTEEARKMGISPPHYAENNKKEPGKLIFGKKFMDKSHHFLTSIIS